MIGWQRPHQGELKQVARLKVGVILLFGGLFSCLLFKHLLNISVPQQAPQTHCGASNIHA